jgi:hypothetical protein
MIPKHRMRDGSVVYYKLTAGYGCVLLTAIVVMLAKGLGWI